METQYTETPILDHNRICHIIERMAWQIYENHYTAKDIYFVGITPRGNILSNLLKDHLQKIAPLTIHSFELSLSKETPHLYPVQINPSLPDVNGKHIVLVDDVLNSGSTLFYAFKPFLNYNPASLTTAVLVDRNHKRFPVFSDVVGIQLSTSLQEHVFVDLSGNHYKVILK
ncbi:phosphoribosyltransferase [Thermaurantimonas aggregans]|uniref:Phosphoribosyltransferase n=1 Tax=Thermaurantimonas aggregans TaxID=2173829 RepID=A0A401XNQ0_9FLAO|nr:phosphoribosyltransferase family protein [Thermaurantimonas aggregans]MCX8147675.1 phosphoribosyltransferase family protein [Thermaurantimonas aggregans]GCD78639.1 phosphoribosyltransferase [Thermaurantimonas aggregans]